MLSPSCSPYGCLSYPIWPTRLWLSSNWAWTWVCDRRNDSPWALVLGSHRALGKPWESPCRWKPGQICRREHEPGSPSRSYFPPCFTLGSCPGGQLCSSSLPDFPMLLRWATFTSGLQALLTYKIKRRKCNWTCSFLSRSKILSKPAELRAQIPGQSSADWYPKDFCPSWLKQSSLSLTADSSTSHTSVKSQNTLTWASALEVLSKLFLHEEQRSWFHKVWERAEVVKQNRQTCYVTVTVQHHSNGYGLVLKAQSTSRVGTPSVK